MKNRPTGRPRCRREDDIERVLKDGLGVCGLCLFGSRQGREAGCCANGDEMSGYKRFWEYLD